MKNLDRRTPRQPRAALPLVTTLLLLLPGLADATPFFQLDIEPGDMQGNFNVPRFTLRNVSTASEEIVGFSITIGDSDAYFFDFVAGPDSAPMGEPGHFSSEIRTGARLATGDRTNDRSGGDLIAWVFDDFQVSEALVFQVDIDPTSALDGGHQSVDARYAFANNGTAANSAIQVLFSNGASARQVFQDSNDLPPKAFRFTGEGRLPVESIGSLPPIQTAPPVPEPTAALLFGFGLLAVATRRPRDRAA